MLWAEIVFLFRTTNAQNRRLERGKVCPVKKQAYYSFVDDFRKQLFEVSRNILNKRAFVLDKLPRRRTAAEYSVYDLFRNSKRRFHKNRSLVTYIIKPVIPKRVSTKIKNLFVRFSLWLSRFNIYLALEYNFLFSPPPKSNLPFRWMHRCGIFKFVPSTIVQFRCWRLIRHSNPGLYYYVAVAVLRNCFS